MAFTTKPRDEDFRKGGIMQSADNTVKMGAMIVMYGVLVFILCCYLLAAALNGQAFTEGPAGIVVSFPFLLALVTVAAMSLTLFLTAGASNVYMGLKSKSADYKNGERMTISVVRTQTICHLADIRREKLCPECGATSGGKFCSGCGRKFSESDDQTDDGCGSADM